MTSELLKFRRNQIRQVTGLTAGHCHLKRHLFKLGLVNSPNYERCHNNEETASYVLYESEALAEVGFCHLGVHFMRSSDYHGLPPKKIPHSAISAGLFADLKIQVHKRTTQWLKFRVFWDVEPCQLQHD
jgi:hypothetical protein